MRELRFQPKDHSANTYQGDSMASAACSSRQALRDFSRYAGPSTRRLRQDTSIIPPTSSAAVSICQSRARYFASTSKDLDEPKKSHRYNYNTSISFSDEPDPDVS
jgi:hypothetical protein